MEQKKIIKAQYGATLFGDQIIQLVGPNNKKMTVRYNPFANQWYDLYTHEVLPSNYVTPDGYKISGDFAVVANQKNAQGVIRNTLTSNQKKSSVEEGAKIGAIIAQKSKDQYIKHQTEAFLHILRKGWRKDENGNWITPERDRVVSSKKNADGTRTVTPRTPYQSKQPVTQESTAPKQPVKSQQQTTSQQTPRQLQGTLSFGQAFAQARKQGLKEFTWKGGRYTTELAKDKKLNQVKRNVKFQVPAFEEMSPEDEQRLNNAKPYNDYQGYMYAKQGGSFLIPRKNTIQRFKQRKKK